MYVPFFTKHDWELLGGHLLCTILSLSRTRSCFRKTSTGSCFKKIKYLSIIGLLFVFALFFVGGGGILYINNSICRNFCLTFSPSLMPNAHNYHNSLAWLTHLIVLLLLQHKLGSSCKNKIKLGFEF